MIRGMMILLFLRQAIVSYKLLIFFVQIILYYTFFYYIKL